MKDAYEGKSIFILQTSIEAVLLAEFKAEIKWARCQRAVTIPWLRTHSILKRIGGDIQC